MKKRRPVLHGHKKVRNTFYPPFLTRSREMGVSIQAIQWRKMMLPELIWLAPLVHDHGYQRACMLASALSNNAGEAANWKIFPHIGTVSWFAKLSSVQKSQVRRRLQAAGVLDDIRKSIAPIVKLYPRFPLKFLFGSEKPTVAKKEAMEYLAPLLWECLFRGERLPMLIQGVFYAMELASGRMSFAEGMDPPLPQDLEDYPKSEESERAAGFIRCTVGQMEAIPVDSFWPEYFWQRGNDLGGCRIPSEPGVAVGEVSQAFIMYHLECYRHYCDEATQIWETAETKRRFNLFDQVRGEVLFGLAARIYRLAVQVTSFIPNWVEDIGQIYVRMAVESYIYWVWFRNHATDEDFKKFYEHGLGQQKLYSEHIRSVLEEEGLSQEEIEEGNAGLEFLKNHKLAEMVTVPLGNPVGKDLRKIAKEADLGEIYSLVFAPTSSMVHGMYDSLERYYLRRCVNPFHCLHRVPFYWTKNSISEYGPVNTLILADWMLAQLMKDVGEEPPTPMPGESFLNRLNDEEEFEKFRTDPSHAPVLESNEQWVAERRDEILNRPQEA